MAATDAQLKRLIIETVHDTPSQALAQAIDGIWLRHDAYALYPGLRYQYALRDAISLVQGVERVMVDTRRDGDRSVSLNQRFHHLQTMYDNATAEINATVALLNTQRGGAIGQIAATTLPYPNELVERLNGEWYIR